jgi:hypothetical protein
MNTLFRAAGDFDISCMLCGRFVGELAAGVFHPNPRVRPPTHARRRVRCGECGGNLYLEPNDVRAMFSRSKATALQVASRSNVA